MLKNLFYQTIKSVLKARGKGTLADVNCYWKMTSVIALNGVTSFLHLKDITNTCKRMRHSPTIEGISSVQWGKLEEAEDFKCVFAVYCMLGSI